MQPIILKVSIKEAKLENNIKEFLFKNSDPSALTEDLNQFLLELQEYRNLLSNLSNISDNIDEIEKYIPVQISYIAQIKSLMQKISFGKDPHSVKIDFIWLDTLKKVNMESNRIEFEYYNSLYNLAALYFLKASTNKKLNPETTSEDHLKIITKTYRYSAGIFEIIKNEINELPEKDRPHDLNPNYLQYCILLCTAYGQEELLRVAELKKSGPELQAKLALGISGLFQEASSLYNESPLEKYGDKGFKKILANRAIYYEAIMYFKLKDAAEVCFNTNGSGFGKLLQYQGEGVKKLINCIENAKNIPKYVDLLALKGRFQKEQKKGEEYFDKNDKVYHQAIPDIKGELYERKVMVTPEVPPEFTERMEKSNTEINGLKDIMPNEIKEMILRYKQKMMNEITNTLNENENEETIKQFMIQTVFPNSVTGNGVEVMKEVIGDIDNVLWIKIENVQKEGGNFKLSNLMQGILNRSTQMEAKLNQTIDNLKREENEDALYRNKYQNEWLRKPSNMLNVQYLSNLNKCVENLRKTRVMDLKEKDDIINLSKYFEIFKLSRNELNAKIPGRDPKKIKQLSNEEKQMRQEYNDLVTLSGKCIQIIKSIFESLDQDLKNNTLFLEVLQSKTTEAQMFEKKKEEFQVKFDQLASITSQIRQKEKTLLDLNLKLHSSGSALTEKPETIEFKKNLNHYADLYFQKLLKLDNAMKFYENMYSKIEHCNKTSTDFLIKRDQEKQTLLHYLIAKQQQINQNQFNAAPISYPNPSQNQMSNMNAPNYVRKQSYNPNVNNQFRQQYQMGNIPNQSYQIQGQFRPNQNYNQNQNLFYNFSQVNNQRGRGNF